MTSKGKEVLKSKTWFITGASSGFGREWAEAALDRGDRVVATARSVDRLTDLATRYGDNVFILGLDVTDRAAVFDAVNAAHEHFGRLDIVVNNAGYGQLGMVEELSETDIRDELETNLLGTLWVTQAVLPILRAQAAGHILQVTSEGGVTAFPQFGAYHASKWAVEGLSQALAHEIDAFGVKVTCIEPGPYSTSFGATGLRRSIENPAYDSVRAGIDRTGWALGDPAATRAAILEVVDSDEPPLRVLFGHSFADLETEYETRLSTWRAWQPISLAAFGEPDTAAPARL